MWFDEAVVYQIYPLGLCGAPRENDGVLEHRIVRLLDWVSHIRDLGADCVLLNPVLQSDRHGYDTRDFFQVDCRLGTTEDLKQVLRAFHEAGIRVLFDGVFHHVGRGFWAFQDVREKKWDSPYKDWFHLSFDGDTGYQDGFWYEGWEGHQELVKLNLWNGEVKRHLLEAVEYWIREFDIDGLRLDVAYSLDPGFLSELRHFTEQAKAEFVLVGETLHGDYNRWMNENACHSVTNYECYKGLYSSFNSANMHEIGYSLNRQFGPDPWCLYTGKHLLNFVDNHDVTRIASILTDERQLAPLYGLLFGMPGVPAIYYGSEWGMKGDKREGDDVLRPALEEPEENGLTDVIRRLAGAHRESRALLYGGYRNLQIQPKLLVFERECDGERVIVAVNADSEPVVAHFDARAGRGVDLITGKEHDFGGGSELPAFSCAYWKTE